MIREDSTMYLRAIKRAGLASVVIGVVCAGAAQADSEAPATRMDAVVEFPAHQDLRLYATDFRGRQAPGMDVEYWLPARPDLDGRVVLVEFWATWCGPCKDSIPKLNKWHERYGDDLLVVGMGDETRDLVEPFVKQNDMRFPIAIDTRKRMQTALGVQGIPNTFLISADGVVRWQGLPWDLTDETIEQVIAANKALLNGKSGTAQSMQVTGSTTARGAEYPPFDRRARIRAKDVRGKQGPRIEVAKWMNEEPELEDKVIVVEFWATWCGPCVRMIPHVNKLHAKYKDDVAFISLSDETASTVSRFMSRTRMDMHVGVDPSRRMSTKLQVRSIPHVIVMSADGIVRWQGHPAHLREGVLRQIIVANKSDLGLAGSATPAASRFDQ